MQGVAEVVHKQFQQVVLEEQVEVERVQEAQAVLLV
jgi:hypothetical protein